MLGLGKTWRFNVKNELTVSIPTAADVIIRGRRVKFDSTGQQTFEASDATVYSNAAAIANAAYEGGTEQDNSTAKWLGGDFSVVLNAPASSNGRISIYYQRKINGVWPTDGYGRLLISVDVISAGTYTKDFSI
jgi:hypothetical protein